MSLLDNHKTFLETDESINFFIDGCKLFNISLTDELIKKFRFFGKELLRWSDRYSLTSIKDEKGIITRHFFDSLSIVSFIPQKSFLLDIGSGAGFPGIPIKIVCPNLKMVLLEAKRKKVFFLRHIIRNLKLNNVKAFWGRAEDKKFILDFKNKFDLVIGRAVTKVEFFLSLAFPYIKEEGLLIWIGSSHQMIGRDIKGYTILHQEKILIPFTKMVNHIVIFKKA